MKILEPMPSTVPGVGEVLRDFGPAYAASGFLGLVFAASGPTAIILSVGAMGGLSSDQIASWFFGVFFVNGLITITLSWLYRQPLGVYWTIPGTVLVGPALTHLSFAEVVGAFYVTGLIILAVGASGWVRRAMQAVPMPIIMAMVAGVFLKFGLDLVKTVRGDIALGLPMTAAFLLLSAVPNLGRRVPPLLGALLVGAIVIVGLGRFDASTVGSFQVAHPVLAHPAWSANAMLELVIPLAITVLVVQNGQGFAVLAQAGHAAPVNASTVACGIGSLAAASVGAISSCVTGPTNALLVSTGEPRRHYTAAIWMGLLATVFGLLSPAFTRLLLAAPREYIALVAGFAMLRVLQAAFVTAFRDRFSLGALVCFLVTVADVTVLNVGGAFWGLVAGLAISRLLERPDFRVA
ncbi:benzoate/H(+) symporter BenE family transporter [uncultured Methylobacterium sp.]|uniref:benzoate/H(+) symporter BenE family transporter n=1 Tax=uncultured Methylobacterium sp. TaxID=157278 RepID=UPI002619ED71|nr:benzoate/H(+) symporter BenE family transporter [uncultured Methylobacterium sp.]